MVGSKPGLCVRCTLGFSNVLTQCRVNGSCLSRNNNRGLGTHPLGINREFGRGHRVELEKAAEEEKERRKKDEGIKQVSKTRHFLENYESVNCSKTQCLV
jgi:hypothetical protein